MPNRSGSHPAQELHARDLDDFGFELLRVGRHEGEAERSARLVRAGAAGEQAERSAPGGDREHLRGPVGEGGGFVGGDGAGHEGRGVLEAVGDAVGEVLFCVAEEGTEDRGGGGELGQVDAELGGFV